MRNIYSKIRDTFVATDDDNQKHTFKTNIHDSLSVTGGSKNRIKNRFAFLLFFLFVLGGCAGDPSLSSLNPQGPVAQEQLYLMGLSLFIMTFVTIVVVIIFIYIVVRYRQRPGDEHIPKQVNGNLTLEIIWTAIPILLLIILAVPTIIITLDLDEQYPDEETGAEAEFEALAAEDGLRINVTGHLFWWEVEYPEQGIFTSNEIYIPTNERIYFKLTSEDVVHSFWAPSLAGKQDNNPGFDNNLWLQADEPGIYEGRCAELCGSSHALMNFRIVAVEPDEFEQWVASMSEFDATENVTTELVAEGEALFAQNCIACHAVESEVPNPLGPHLAGFGNRSFLAGYLENNEENLAQWIANPYEIKPGSLMPSAVELGLNNADIEALAAYLVSLKHDDQFDLSDYETESTLEQPL